MKAAGIQRLDPSSHTGGCGGVCLSITTYVPILDTDNVFGLPRLLVQFCDISSLLARCSWIVARRVATEVLPFRSTAATYTRKSLNNSTQRTTVNGIRDIANTVLENYRISRTEIVLFAYFCKRMCIIEKSS